VGHCLDGSPACIQVNQPSAETCNNLDDDCDGTIDDGDPGSGAACATGLPGVCAAGTIHCQGGGPTCLSDTAPQAESCDGLDNDCDGSTDETCAPVLALSCKPAIYLLTAGKDLKTKWTFSPATVLPNPADARITKIAGSCAANIAASTGKKTKLNFPGTGLAQAIGACGAAGPIPTSKALAVPLALTLEGTTLGGQGYRTTCQIRVWRKP
jgi:hypothetical protein